MATDWKPGDPIGYVRPEIPDFEMPDYQGERYEAMVPGHLGPSRTSRPRRSRSDREHQPPSRL